MAWFAWALVASLSVSLAAEDDAPALSVEADAPLDAQVSASDASPAPGGPTVEATVQGQTVSLGQREDAPEEPEPAPDAEPTASRMEPAQAFVEDHGASVSLVALLLGSLASAYVSARGGLPGRFARWLLALPLLGLFSRLHRDELEDHPVRKAVMEALDAHPGACVEDVQATVGAAYGTVRYHLDRLERAGLVVAHVDGRRRRYWRMEEPTARHRPAASLLLSETPQRIADVVRRRPGLNQRQLARELDIAPPVACKYLRRLESEGLVRGLREGRTKRYHPGDALARLAAPTHAPGAVPVAA